MKHPDRESQLVEFYRQARLPEDRVEAILSAASLARSERRWRTRAIAVSIALVIVVGVCLWLFSQTTDLRQQLASQPQDGSNEEAARPEQQNNSQDEVVETGRSGVQVAEDRAEAPAAGFRLVAFRSHDDRCPHCRATGEMVARLQTEMADRPLEIEQFALQRQDGRPAMLARIDALNLTSLVADQPETAFGLLLSPSGAPLRRLDPDQPAAAINAQILDIIEQ